MDPLVYVKRVHLKSMTLFYPWWLHGLWGLWVVWTLPHIGAQYYSQRSYCIAIYISLLYFYIHLRVICIFAYTQSWHHVLNNFSLYCTCFKLFYIEMSSVMCVCKDTYNSEMYVKIQINWCIKKYNNFCGSFSNRQP